MGFRILESRAGRCRAAIEGEMTIYTVAALKEDISRALAQWGEAEIDLAEVDAIDTAGLQLLLMAKRAGKAVGFVAHSRAVADLLRLSGLAEAAGAPGQA